MGDIRIGQEWGIGINIRENPIVRGMADDTVSPFASVDIGMTRLTKSFIQGLNEELAMFQKVVFIRTAVPVRFCHMHAVTRLADHFPLRRIKNDVAVGDPSDSTTVSFIIDGPP